MLNEWRCSQRRIVHFNVTEHPTENWTAQQIREAFPWDEAPRYLIRDRDAIFANDIVTTTKGMGIEEVVIAPRSPWQNPYVERLIGSIRRGCLDHMIVWNERSLCRILHSYVHYYNYASYCPPRYVVENSKPFCCDVGIAGCRLPRRTRSTNLAVASVSNAR
jgi:Integrase core domain